MNSKYKLIQTYGIWLLDLICIIVSYRISRVIRFGKTDFHLRNFSSNQMIILFILFCFAYNFFLDWNHDYLVRGALKEFTAVLKYNATMLLVLVVYVFLTHSYAFASRLVVGRFLVINFILMFVSHVLVKRVLCAFLQGEKTVRKLLVVAEPQLMAETINRVRQSLGVGTQIVAAAYAVDEPASGEKAQVEGISVLPGLCDLTEVFVQTPLDEVLINTPDISQRRLKKMIIGFEEMGVTCHYNLEIPGTGAAFSHVGSFGSYSVITYQKTLVSQKRLFAKRIFDIIGGLVGLAITGILTIFIAPAIKLDSPGPVFFSQVRVGKNGRRFRIYKFRSMYQDAEERKKDLMKQNEMSGLMFKMEDDPRVTKVGAFLRKTSLDEFPQFLNVLKGDMSLVGTRPPTEKEFEQYDEHYRRRISMTPGLTGMWQVSGRSDITDFDEVVRLDLEYIDNWSLTLDLKILLQTVGVLFSHRGAK